MILKRILTRLSDETHNMKSNQEHFVRDLFALSCVREIQRISPSGSGLKLIQLGYKTCFDFSMNACIYNDEIYVFRTTFKHFVVIA